MGVSPASPSPLSGRGAVGLKAERARAGALPVRVAPCPVLPSGALEAKVPRQLAQQRRVNVPRLRLGERAAECCRRCARQASETCRPSHTRSARDAQSELQRASPSGTRRTPHGQGPPAAGGRAREAAGRRCRGTRRSAVAQPATVRRGCPTHRRMKRTQERASSIGCVAYRNPTRVRFAVRTRGWT